MAEGREAELDRREALGVSAFDGLDRRQLAALVREYLLCGHLIDRSGMAHVLGEFGLDGMRDVAIDEWMGASPIYTRRMQRLLNFEGSDVETIFKGMQVDIGAPPQFMDFRYTIVDPARGEFWLDCCGALMDVEPMGDEFVVNMCHHIEDPTFDATAAATNPRARMRPIHRPPRVPAGREPHCHWEVAIDPGAEPLPEPPQAERIAGTRAAALPLHDHDGAVDYAGPLQPDLAFERFSDSTLVALLEEIALQGHLLTLSFADAIERRSDAATAAEIVRKQFTGIAGLAAERIAAVLGTSDIARVIALHPAFHPLAYIDVRIDGDTIELADCPAIGDRPGRTWADVLSDGGTEPLDAIVRAVDPRASVTKTGRRRWSVGIGDGPQRESREVRVTKVSTGATFAFEDRT
jgi:hypothetical protein